MKDSLRRLKEASRDLTVARVSGAKARAEVRKRPKARARRSPVDVTRAEFEALVSVLGRRGELIERLMRDNDLHVRRIAQLQAALDSLTAQLSELRCGVAPASAEPARR